MKQRDMMKIEERSLFESTLYTLQGMYARYGNLAKRGVICFDDELYCLLKDAVKEAGYSYDSLSTFSIYSALNGDLTTIFLRMTGYTTSLGSSRRTKIFMKPDNDWSRDILDRLAALLTDTGYVSICGTVDISDFSRSLRDSFVNDATKNVTGNYKYLFSRDLLLKRVPIVIGKNTTEDAFLIRDYNL